MDTEKIIDAIRLYRKFSPIAMEKQCEIPHQELQSVMDELKSKGLLVQDGDKFKFIEKSELFHIIYSILEETYNSADITAQETELLAWELEYEIETSDLNFICSTVCNFWEVLLWCRKQGKEIDDFYFDATYELDDIISENFDSDFTKDYEIFLDIIRDLPVNEKYAHKLYVSFLNFNEYHSFQRLVTDFREFLSENELKKVFEVAECFDSFLVIVINERGGKNENHFS